MRLPLAAISCLTLPAALLLTGCGAGFSPAVSPLADAVSLGTIHGAVHGGNPPIVGAQVYLYAISQNGYGTASTSVLKASGNTTADSNGNYYVTTDSRGNFSISGDYTCSANEILYLLANGGNPGNGTANPAIAQLAVLGNCGSTAGDLSASVPFIVINEVSTVAAAYVFAPFATSPTSIGRSGGTGLSMTGAANAVANVANMINIGTGTALSTPASAPGTVPQGKINMLANVLAGCVNSIPTASGCTQLFADAPNADGTSPTTTGKAMINIAQNVSRNTATISALSGTPATNGYFQPADASETDFAMGINFTTPILDTPTPASNPSSGPVYTNIAIDASGNVWTADSSNGGALYQFSPMGVATTFPNAAAKSNLTGLTISPTNPVTGKFLWFVDGINGKLYTYDNAGNRQKTVILAGASAVAFDAAAQANAFVTTYTQSGNGTVVEFAHNEAGTPATFQLAVGGVGAIGIDSNNSLFTPSTSSNHLGYSPSAYTAPVSYTVPAAASVAMSGKGTAWTPDFTNNAVDATDKAGNRKFTCTGGGLNTPSDLVLDGNGNVWVGNNGPDTSLTISGFTNNCVNLSPNASGSFTGGIQNGSNPAYAETTVSIAVDASGNVWALNAGETQQNGTPVISLTQFIGLAEPATVPLSAANLTTTP